MNTITHPLPAHGSTDQVSLRRALQAALSALSTLERQGCICRAAHLTTALTPAVVVIIDPPPPGVLPAYGYIPAPAGMRQAPVTARALLGEEVAVQWTLQPPRRRLSGCWNGHPAGGVA